MSAAVLDMAEDVSGILLKKPAVSLAVISKFKEKVLVRIGPLEERSAEKIPLREEGALFPCVAGLRLGLNPAGLLHVGREVFVHRHILFGEKIVILVVRVEVFHDFGVERVLRP